MTLSLTIMRHAKSSWDHPGLGDRDRPLNDRGHRSALAMGDWLRARGVSPDIVLCSSARRTMETFEGLALDCPVIFTDALYHASAMTMLKVLSQADAPSVLMLGHNPGIADFAEMIVSVAPNHGRFHDYPTCATLIVEFDAPGWGHVAWGTGHVQDFAIPREVLTQTQKGDP